MTKPEPIEGLSEDERDLVLQALQALRRDRGLAWNIACDIAERAGKRRPSVKSYGIDEIEKQRKKRNKILSRR